MSGIGGGSLLWALGAEEIVPAIIAILIMLVSGLSQWLGKMKQPQRPGNAPQPPVIVAPPRQAPAEELAMEDEIGEFLRRTAKRRGPQAAQSPPALEPVLVEPERSGPVGGQVEAHVKGFLNTGEFSQRSAQLGEEVAQADEHLGEHLHQVFDHDVSSLAATPGEISAQPATAGGPSSDAAALPVTAAAGLAAMLSDMENVRQAIVINEILRRPEERWS
jgi:hypothetical protein